jgi:hypothetical protein
MLLGIDLSNTLMYNGIFKVIRVTFMPLLTEKYPHLKALIEQCGESLPAIKQLYAAGAKKTLRFKTDGLNPVFTEYSTEVATEAGHSWCETLRTNWDLIQRNRALPREEFILPADEIQGFKQLATLEKKVLHLQNLIELICNPPFGFDMNYQSMQHYKYYSSLLLSFLDDYTNIDSYRYTQEGIAALLNLMQQIATLEHEYNAPHNRLNSMQIASELEATQQQYDSIIENLKKYIEALVNPLVYYEKCHNEVAKDLLAQAQKIFTHLHQELSLNIQREAFLLSSREIIISTLLDAINDFMDLEIYITDRNDAEKNIFFIISRLINPITAQNTIKKLSDIASHHNPESFVKQIEAVKKEVCIELGAATPLCEEDEQIARKTKELEMLNEHHTLKIYFNYMFALNRMSADDKIRDLLKMTNIACDNYVKKSIVEPTAIKLIVAMKFLGMDYDTATDLKKLIQSASTMPHTEVKTHLLLVKQIKGQIQGFINATQLPSTPNRGSFFILRAAHQDKLVLEDGRGSPDSATSSTLISAGGSPVIANPGP